MVLNSKYFEDYMKEALIQKGIQAANDIKFDGEDRFWIPVRRYNQKDDVHVNAGEIQISVALMPKSHAEKYPQGAGR
mgnify:CR=1 FL=1